MICRHWWQFGQALFSQSVYLYNLVKVSVVWSFSFLCADDSTVPRMQTLFLGSYVYNFVVVSPAVITVVDYSVHSMLAFTECDSSCLTLLLVPSRRVL